MIKITPKLLIAMAVCIFALVVCVWGSSIVSTSLSNMIVGGPNLTQGALRFNALHAAPLSSWHFYVIDKYPGYSGGTGGKILVTLRAEQQVGVPSTTILATAYKSSDPEWSDPTSGRGRFPLVTFSPQVTLTKGAWYWLVVTDVDPTPKVNYFSLDFLFDKTVLSQASSNASVWIGNAGTFKPVTYLIPSPDVIQYADGAWQGLGWIAAVPSLECGSGYGFPAASCY